MGEYKYESMRVWEYGSMGARKPVSKLMSEYFSVKNIFTNTPKLSYSHTPILLSRFPLYFLNTIQESNVSGENKQIITQPVEVFNDQRLAERFKCVEFYCNSFCATADSTADMGGRNSGVSAGQYERFHFRQFFIH